MLSSLTASPSRMSGELDSVDLKELGLPSQGVSDIKICHKFKYEQFLGLNNNKSAITPITDLSSSPGCLRENVDFNGGDITNFRTKDKNVDECKSRCMKHAGCVAFTYHKGNGHCWLKHGGYRHGTRNDNLISGTKFCYVTGYLNYFFIKLTVIKLLCEFSVKFSVIFL